MSRVSAEDEPHWAINRLGKRASAHAHAGGGARPALAGHLMAIDEARPSVRGPGRVSEPPPDRPGMKPFPSELEPPEADRALETIDAGTDNGLVVDGPLSDECLTARQRKRTTADTHKRLRTTRAGEGPRSSRSHPSCFGTKRSPCHNRARSRG